MRSGKGKREGATSRLLNLNKKSSQINGGASCWDVKRILRGERSSVFEIHPGRDSVNFMRVEENYLLTICFFFVFVFLEGRGVSPPRFPKFHFLALPSLWKMTSSDLAKYRIIVRWSSTSRKLIFGWPCLHWHWDWSSKHVTTIFVFIMSWRSWSCSALYVLFSLTGVYSLGELKW